MSDYASRTSLYQRLKKAWLGNVFRVHVGTRIVHLKVDYIEPAKAKCIGCGADFAAKPNQRHCTVRCGRNASQRARTAATFAAAEVSA